MNLKIAVTSLCFIMCSVAFADGISINKLKCIADTGGAQRVSVPVQKTMGSAPETKLDYNGSQLSVGFFPGNQYESQQILVLDLNGYESRIYDPKNSLYMIEAPNSVKIQCYIEQ